MGSRLPAGGVRAHGEDGVGGAGGADRALVAARLTRHRAHRVGARRCRAGGAEGGRPAAAGRRAGRAGPGSGCRVAPAPAVVGRCRSRPRGWGTCGTRLSHAYEVLGFDAPTGGTRCSGSWCWRGSSSRPASWTRCGCWRRSGSPPLVRDGDAAAAGVRHRRRGGRSWPRPAPRTPGLGPATLVLYDVSTLYFETDAGDGFREPGFSKERRLEPQITDRAAHRRGRVPVDGQRVRGQQGRDHHDAAGHHGVHGRPPTCPT